MARDDVAEFSSPFGPCLAGRPGESLAAESDREARSLSGRPRGAPPVMMTKSSKSMLSPLPRYLSRSGRSRAAAHCPCRRSASSSAGSYGECGVARSGSPVRSRVRPELPDRQCSAHPSRGSGRPGRSSREFPKALPCRSRMVVWRRSSCCLMPSTPLYRLPLEENSTDVDPFPQLTGVQIGLDL